MIKYAAAILFLVLAVILGPAALSPAAAQAPQAPPIAAPVGPAAQSVSLDRKSVV